VASSAQKLHVKMLSPGKVLLDTHAYHVNVPGKLGAMGLLPGHASMIAELNDGIVKIEGGDLSAPQAFTIRDGYVQVENNEVSILVDEAKPITLQ
jgi:F-type H+-transporting ATPase subunit epsilon